MVRAKFKVKAITPYADTTNIILEPVKDGSEENKSFFKWTPSGMISLGCINPEAIKQFYEGQEVYVDFTSASEGES